MKKKFIITIALLALIVISYSIAWQLVLARAANNINVNYANKDIPISKSINGNARNIKFAKATPAGYPFKWALRLTGWTEEDNVNKIEFNEPIYIGYDLLTQNVFMSNSGEIYAKIKPLETGFGSKIKVGNCSLNISLPLSIGLVKALKNASKDNLKLINYIGKIEFRADNIQIFDLFDNKQLYDLDHELAQFSFDKSIHYNNLEEFLNNIPQSAEIYHSVKINKSLMSQKILPDNLLYGFAWKNSFTSSGKFYLKTTAKTLKEAIKDIEVNCPDFKFENEVFSNESNIFYKAYQPVVKKDLIIRMTSKMELKTGFFESLQNLLQNSGGHPGPIQRVKEEVSYIVNHKNDFKLVELENRKYDSVIDINFIQNPNAIKMVINDFALFSGKTGIKLRDDTDYNNKSFQWKSSGLLSLNNYPKIIDFASGYVHRLGKIPAAIPQIQTIAVEVATSFLRTICDHPGSKSNDISFSYALDSSNLAKGKVGTIEYGQLEPLYYLALYKYTAGKINLDDKTMDRIKELIPMLNNPQGSLPTKVQEKINDVIKNPSKIFKKDILKQFMK